MNVLSKLMEETINPAIEEMARLQGKRWIFPRDESETFYPSVWKVDGFSPEWGKMHINVNKLKDKYQNVQKNKPF